MTGRLLKINALLKKETGKILKEEVDLESDALLTVTQVRASRTFEHAIIWVSVYPEKQTQKALAYLNKNIYRIQKILNRRLKIKSTPKIIFKIDPGEEKASKIDRILESVG